MKTFPTSNDHEGNRRMTRMTLMTPTHVHLLLGGDGVELLDEDTVEVDAPAWMGGGRIPVEAWMVDV
jgi:hypothetical protein